MIELGNNNNNRSRSLYFKQVLIGFYGKIQDVDAAMRVYESLSGNDRNIVALELIMNAVLIMDNDSVAVI